MARRRRISLHPAPSPALRNLTLGVLIVSGGTFAALPFRRYPNGDASDARSAVSGPSSSALDTTLESTPIGATTIATNTLDSLPTWNPPPIGARSRQLDIPLTYEDLARPITPPAAIEERFSATARVYQKSTEQAAQSTFTLPELQPLPVDSGEQLDALPAPSLGGSSGPDWLANTAATGNGFVANSGANMAPGSAIAPGSVAQPTSPLNTPNPSSADRGGEAGGILASSVPPESTFRPSPNAEPPRREHHWIRQP